LNRCGTTRVSGVLLEIAHVEIRVPESQICVVTWMRARQALGLTTQPQESHESNFQKNEDRVDSLLRYCHHPFALMLILGSTEHIILLSQ